MNILLCYHQVKNRFRTMGLKINNVNNEMKTGNTESKDQHRYRKEKDEKIYNYFMGFGWNTVGF